MGLPSWLVFPFLCFLNIFSMNSGKTKPFREDEPVLFGGNFPALYIIGDSLVDSGNNNYLEIYLKANHTPYGSNFEGGIPTGRFSDGKTIADYIAIYYKLPLVPAYLGLSEAQKNNISTGINYASGACGILPDAGKEAGKCLSFSVQVDLFNQTIEKNLKKTFKTQSKLNNHLAESLFIIAIGANDYFSAYSHLTDVNMFANMLLQKYLVQLQRLYELGARKFFINNLKPLGCYPNIIANTTPRGSCNESLNSAIANFNVKLRASLSNMNHKLPKTSFLYSDYFSFMLGLRGPSKNQVSSDLWNTISPCCPEGYDGGLGLCKSDSIACKVPGTHIFFDPSHPSQLANFMYSIQCFHERIICHVV